MSLPSDYSHFSSAWESTADDQQTIENLTSRLVMEEARIAQQRKGQIEATEALQLRKNSNGKRGTCHTCKQSGHYMRDCPTNKTKAQENRNSDRSGNRNPRKSGDACLAGNIFGNTKVFFESKRGK